MSSRRSSHGRPEGSSSQVVAAGLLASRALGLVREGLVAHLVGTGAAADALQAALRGPNILQNLLGDQALSASFVPIYSRFLGQNRLADARRFAGAILGILCIAAAALAVAGILVAPAWVAALYPGFLAKPELYRVTVEAVRILFPMTGVLVLCAWCLAVLNSHRRFFLPYFAPMFWNLSLVGGLLWLLFRGPVPGLGTFVLTVAFAALFGALLQFGVQIAAAWRSSGRPLPIPSLEAPGVRPALAAFGPAFLGRGVVQISSLLDWWLASFLLEGAISSMAYAQRLYLLPVALFGTAFAVVELPELSRMRPEAASGSTSGPGVISPEIQRRLGRVFSSMGFLIVPSVIGFLVFGWLIVAAVYARGRFGASDTWLVYVVLSGYTVGMIATTSSRLLQNAFFTLGDTRTPARLAALRVLMAGSTGVLFMLVLDRFSVAHITSLLGIEGVTDTALHLGAVGLAVASGGSAWLELWRLHSCLRLAGEGSSSVQLPWRRVWRFVAIAISALLPGVTLWWLMRGLAAPLTAFAVVGVFAGSYLVLAHFWCAEESTQFWARLGRSR